MDLSFSDKQKTGEVLDREHEALIFSLKDVLDASFRRDEGSPSATMVELLNTLLTTAKSHFRHEEDFYEKINHPDRVAHRNEHLELEKEFEEEILKNHMNCQHNELTWKLEKWIIVHILVWDKRPMCSYSPVSKGLI